VKRFVAVVLAIVLLIQCSAAMAQSLPNVAPQAAPSTNTRPIVVGLGAIAGIVVFNVLALGVEALPGGLAYGAGATVPAEMSVAMSRVYATISAVIGGVVGYSVATAEQTPSQSWLVDRRLLAVGAGAIAGAVAFNVLAAPLGTVPFAGGVLEAVPYSVALGSRLIAVTATVAGMLGATWVYDKWSGSHSDYRYLFTLGAGALAGVAAGNYLTMGILGTPPYYLGAAAADTTGAIASSAAQAASRVYVIGSAVLGAWVADYLYRR
jgi:hypothetical protein